MSTDYIGEHRAPRALTIFGREPAAWVGLIEAVVAVLILLPIADALNLSPEWAVVFMAVVSGAAGIFTAWATKDTMLGAITGFVKALIGLVAFYGLDLGPELQASVVALTAVIVGFFQRTQTSPVAFPVDPSPPQVVPVPGTTLPEETVQRGVYFDQEEMTPEQAKAFQDAYRAAMQRGTP